MNFRQAYDGWSQQEENRQLFTKTKEAFRKAWFTLPTNKPCSYYTKEVLGKALSETRVIDSMKVNAASIAVHILNWAAWAEPKWNPKPDFTMDDLMEIARRPKAADETPELSPAPEPPAEKEPEEDVTDLDIDPVTALPRKTMDKEDFCKGCNNVKGCITCHNGSEWARIIPAGDHEALVDALTASADRILNDKPKDDMNNEKKKSGRAPIPVAQLDPVSLNVIRVWPSRSEAEKGTGACNIDRAIQKCRKAAGFYWCKPEEVNVFNARLQEKLKAKPEKKAVKKPGPAAKKGWLPKYRVGQMMFVRTTDGQILTVPGVIISVNTDTRDYSVEVLEGVHRFLEKDLVPAEWNSETEDVRIPMSAVRESERDSRVSAGLEAYTDQQLKDELVRRGWRGKLSRMEELLLE